jgi:hypothetical protein
MDEWGYGGDEPIACCPSCGIPYRDHMGLHGTCKQLIESQARLTSAMKLIKLNQGVQIPIGKLVLSVTLDVELTNKNDGQGHSWHHTAKSRKDYESHLRAMGHSRKAFKRKVNLKITRILGRGQRLWDQSSVLRGSAKQLEDALVSCGWFVDDSPEWIGLVIGDQEVPTKRVHPQVKIEVFES